MNKEIFFGRNSFRFWYYRYKDSAYYSITVIIVTIVICVLLLFNFILPQLEQWFSIRNEVIATRERIAAINDNIAYLNTMDRNQLNAQVKTTSTALPPEKNFGTILDALSVSALRSGVSFQDYTFQVGSVSSSSAQLSSAKLKGIASVTVSVIINGTVEEVRGFMHEITQTLPLSEVTAVEGATGAVTVTIDFYQKNLPKVTLKDDQPIPHVIEINVSEINKLAQWQVAPRIIDSGTATGSSSGIPLF